MSRRALTTGGALLVMAAFVALMAWGTVNKPSVTGKSGFTRVGKPAADFQFTRFDGEHLVLAEHIGTPTVINFWASWCPPCREEARVLERIWRQYSAEELLIVGVDIQDTDEEAIAFLEEFGVTYPNGRDIDGTITVDYGVIGIPVTFFVGRDGIVQRRWVGAVRDDDLEVWVRELIDGRAAGQTEGKNLDEYFELEQRD